MAYFATFPYTSTSEISALSYTWPLKKIPLFDGASPYRLEIRQEGTSQLCIQTVFFIIMIPPVPICDLAYDFHEKNEDFLVAQGQKLVGSGHPSLLEHCLVPCGGIRQ